VAACGREVREKAGGRRAVGDLKAAQFGWAESDSESEQRARKQASRIFWVGLMGCVRSVLTVVDARPTPTLQAHLHSSPPSLGAHRPHTTGLRLARPLTDDGDLSAASQSAVLGSGERQIAKQQLPFPVQDDFPTTPAAPFAAFCPESP
jgi:hypothetical protein